jgi:acetyltransferase-like isoleucine patch superfamily enzyme
MQILEYALRLMTVGVDYLRGFLIFQKLMRVESGVRVIGRWNLNIGKNVRLCRDARIDAVNGSVHLGDNVKIGDRGVVLIANGATIVIESDVHISGNSHLAAYGGGDISIGKNTLLGPNCIVISQNHGVDDISKPIKYQEVPGGCILIKENVWIAANVAVLPGAKINSGSVIGANAVVTKKSEINENCIYAGNPVKFLRFRK